jgi:Uma2 family endonuclease
MSAADGMIDLSRVGVTGGLSIDDLPDDVPGVRMELIDGSLIVTPLGDWQHQELITRFSARLVPVVPVDLTVLAGVNVIVGERTLLIPDLVVADGRFRVRGGLGVSPEGLRLVVEVSSPSTRRHDLTIKRELYRQWQVPYLIVDRVTDPFTLEVEGELPEWAKLLLDVKGAPSPS